MSAGSSAFSNSVLVSVRINRNDRELKTPPFLLYRRKREAFLGSLAAQRLSHGVADAVADVADGIARAVHDVTDGVARAVDHVADGVAGSV